MKLRFYVICIYIIKIILETYLVVVYDFDRSCFFFYCFIVNNTGIEFNKQIQCEIQVICLKCLIDCLALI